jgi:hypothetical protein
MSDDITGVEEEDIGEMENRKVIIRQSFGLGEKVPDSYLVIYI